jgi:hypothetical protein
MPVRVVLVDLGTLRTTTGFLVTAVASFLVAIGT